MYIKASSSLHELVVSPSLLNRHHFGGDELALPGIPKVVSIFSNSQDTAAVGACEVDHKSHHYIRHSTRIRIIILGSSGYRLFAKGREESANKSRANAAALGGIRLVSCSSWLQDAVRQLARRNAFSMLPL